ncbi:MAG TPA: hypothetical protein VGZ02_05255 [Candidatus Baltobacteraceae bacterium]|jgi:hypothetical protein|nr:hypothetical protein [Candidatus Baltobacteraceae bacterium]
MSQADSDDAARAAAYHNAGHAVARALIDTGAKDEVCSNPAHEQRRRAEFEAMTALGSVAAEHIFLGAAEPRGAENDIAFALKQIAAITPNAAEQRAYVDFLSVRVRCLLESHRDFVEYVALSLLQSGGDAAEIARSHVTRFVR